MKTVAKDSVTKGVRPKQCRVIFLYGDDLLARQADCIHEHLRRSLAGECLLVAFQWSFAEAVLGKARETLVENLKNADIVTLAVRDDRGIPDSVTDLLREGWRNKAIKPAALALLVGRTEQDARSATQLILSTRALAHAYGLDFLPSEFALSTCIMSKTNIQNEKV